MANEAGDTGSLTKKAGRNIPGSMGDALHLQQTGYDLSAMSHADGAPRPPVFLRGERQTRGRKAGTVLPCHGVTLATDFRQDNETPLQLQPELCKGDASVSVIQAARRRRQ